MKVLFIRLIGMMVLMLTVGEIFGQQGTIKIIDAKSKEVIPFATVCFQGLKTTSLKQAVTDMDGKVLNDLKETSKIAVTYVGYETLMDTVEPGVSTTISLVPAVLNMSEFVVTGQFKPEKADKSIYKINVINSRQIERKAATNLTDLLSTESNMRISQGGVLGTSLSIQGLSGENVKFLIDGVPIIGRLNGNIDMNQLNLYNVDHIEIIEGPMSVIYGSNAIAGVVNIITKENKNSALTAFANAYFESVGVYNLSAGSSVRVKKNTFSIDLSRTFFDGYTTVPDLRSLEWNPKLQYNVDAYYLLTTGKIRAKLSIQYFDELLKDYGNLDSTYFETAEDQNFHTIRQTSKVEGTYTISANRQISMVGAYSTYNRKRNLYYNDLTKLEKTIISGDTNNVNNYLLRAWYSRNFSNQKLNYQVGFDGNLEKFEGERIQDASQDIGDYAGFISVKYEPLSKISFQPGVRFIYNTKYDAPIVYNLNAKYSITANTSIRSSYARGFRSPTIKELYLEFEDSNHDLKGDSNLQAEYSHNVNLNFSYNRETRKTFLNTDFGLFYNYVDNMIGLFQDGKKITSYTYGNVSKFISQGAQVNATVNFYPKITLKGGVSLVGRKFPTDIDTVAETGFQYSTDFNAMATYNFDKLNASLTVDYKYTGRFPILIPDSTFNNQYTDGYSNLDITLMKSFMQNRFSISVGGKNLFNVKTVQSGMASGGGAHSGGGDGTMSVAWGRTAFIKFTYNFKKS